MLTVLGIFHLLDKEISLLVVTALLTLAGKMPFKEVINTSITEVLSRTTITSGTVAIVLVALLTMGGVLRHDFALALLIGVVVGTYTRRSS